MLVGHRLSHCVIISLLMNRFLTLVFALISLQAIAQPFKQEGLGTYYNDKYQGANTANGEKYDKDALTAAHKTLPFGTMVVVTRLDNNKQVVVRINDRSGSTKYIIDLSRKAAAALGIDKEGQAMVKLTIQGEEEVVAPPPPVEVPVEVVPPPVEVTPPPVEVAPPPVVVAPPPVVIPETAEIDFYKIGVSKLPKTRGYSLQIGRFNNYDEVISFIAKLNKDLAPKMMVVSISTKAEKIYKIILGAFPNEKAAERYSKKVQKKYKTRSLIINLDEVEEAPKVESNGLVPVISQPKKD